MTATLIFLIVTLSLMLAMSISHRRRHLLGIEFVNSESSRLGNQILKALNKSIQNEHRLEELNKLLGPDAMIDVGHGRDVGWLILACKVNGQDRVLLQELRKDMSMQEYKILIENLSHDFRHVAFIDTPYHEQFLYSEDKLFRRSRR